MPKSNYPPSWRPGYALPGNVQAEGVERRAFVTKWSPRGTYDSSMNPTGGYAQPAYVMAEGVGQGTFTTDWVDSGTYMGPRIPHWSNRQPNVSLSSGGPAGGGQYLKIKPGKLSGLGGVSGSGAASGKLFPAYGQAAATQILSRVNKLPPAKRKQALQQILNSVDPSLWGKVATTTNQHIARGASPMTALHKAISQHFATGIGNEVVALGKGRRPRKGSHLGLGFYAAQAARAPRSGLGATTASLVPQATQVSGPVSTVQVWLPTTVAGVSIEDGQCTSDGKLVWFHGQWRIMTPSDPPCTSNASVTALQVIATGVQLYVGPFPYDKPLQIYTTPGSLPSGALSYIGQKIQASAQAAGLTSGPAITQTYGPWLWPMDTYSGTGSAYCPTNGAPPQCTTTASLSQAQPGLTGTVGIGKDAQGNQCHIYSTPQNPLAGQWYDVCDWLNAIGIAPSPAAATVPWEPSRATKTVGIINGVDTCDVQASPLASLFDQFDELNYGDPNPDDGDAPFFKFVDPISGTTKGVWLAFGLDSKAVNSPGIYVSDLGRPQSVHLEVGIRDIPSCDLCFLKTILEYIFWLPAQIFTDVAEVVATTLSAVGAVACAVMKQPGAVAAGQAAGQAVSGPAGGAAGAAGAAAAQAVCGGTSAPPPMLATTSMTLPLILLGLGATALIISRHKKKPQGAP